MGENRYIYIYIFFFSFFLTNSKIISLSIIDQRRYTLEELHADRGIVCPTLRLAFSFVDGTLYCSSAAFSRIISSMRDNQKEEIKRKIKETKEMRTKRTQPTQYASTYKRSKRRVNARNCTIFLSSTFIERRWNAVRPFYYFPFCHFFFFFLFHFLWSHRHRDPRDISVLTR